jgi:signal transduction histidine kinase
MRTANNTNNNLPVEKLVNKYCTYVNPSRGEKGYNKFGFDSAKAEHVAGAQLLVTLYSTVAGIEADNNVLLALSVYAERYQKDALEEEEFVFLCEHFKDVVSYVFADMDSGLAPRVPSNIIKLVQEMIKPKEGQTIFLTHAGCGDIAALFPGCIVRGFTGDSLYSTYKLENWALGQIRLYALGVKSEIVPIDYKPEGYNDKANAYISTLLEKESADIVIYGSGGAPDLKSVDIQQSYELLKEGGTMFWFAEKSTMVGNGYGNSFRNQLVLEKSINTLASFKVVPKGWMRQNIILTHIEKRAHKSVRIINDKEGKSAVIKAEELDRDILWPSYYLAKRPSTGKPLSSIVKLPSNRRKRLADYVQGGNRLYHSGPRPKFDLSDFPDLEYIPVVAYHDLGDSYKDANLMEKEVHTVADDVNTNKYNVVDAMAFLGLENQPCVFISENAEGLRIGYTTQVAKHGYAYDPDRCCLLYPQKEIDPRYVVALLFLPSVAEQIITICEGEIRMLSLVLDKIIVPDHNEKERLAFLSEANYQALISSKQELRQQHEQFRKSVRMRKHALTQSLSSIEAMFYALNKHRIRQKGNLSDNEIISRVKGTTVREAFEFLERNVEEMMPLMEHMADVEYSFGKPEWMDPEKFIEEYVSKYENGWLNFKPVITWEKGHNQAIEEIKDPTSGEIILHKGDSINQFLFPKDALERVFKNIISNAQSHGFTDKSRKDYQLKFSWHINGMALIIEIENNGTPIPSDRDTASLLEYGVSTALHHDGHNGIGCNEIDDIMQRYDGKVEIISSPENLFPVKYVLTFNRSNTIR